MPIEVGSREEARLDVEACRRQFPALQRLHDDRPAVFFDGPAGSQTPQCVIDAIARYMVECNANHGGAFATSRASDDLLRRAHGAAADLFGANDSDEIVFGANMTTITFAVSRAIARTWRSGDEVIVTQLDHDANVTPWVLAARDAGAAVRHVDIRRDDCTLDLDDLRRKLSGRTRMVAVGCVSNAIGTVNHVAEVARLAHDAGALVYADAVHLVPHRLPDVAALGCDFLAASAYKFFGPHVGLLWGRRELLERFEPYKVRPAPNHVPDRWMTGTQSHEGIAGVLAAIEYLVSLATPQVDVPSTVGQEARPSAPNAAALPPLPLGERRGGRGEGEPAKRVAPLRRSLERAYAAIRAHEHGLAATMLDGLARLPQYHVYGVTDRSRSAERVATFGLRHSRMPARLVAEHLDRRGIYAWHGNFYALCLSEALGLEPEGMLRLGMLHYNTVDEVERTLSALAELA